MNIEVVLAIGGIILVVLGILGRQIKLRPKSSKLILVIL